MDDMHAVIVPKSDQTNADDLLSAPRTIKVTRVTVAPTGEQRVSIFFEGDDGKPYKPGKSMCRVLVRAWGDDSKAYVGKSMTLYRDESVKWGGVKVGGIRISHMTDIEGFTIALTETRKSRVPFTVAALKLPPTARQGTASTPAADPVGSEASEAGQAPATNRRTVGQVLDAMEGLLKVATTREQVDDLIGTKDAASLNQYAKGEGAERWQAMVQAALAKTDPGHFPGDTPIEGE